MSAVCVMLYILLVAWAYVCYVICFGTIECELYTTSTLHNIVQLLEKGFKKAQKSFSLFQFDLFCKALYSRAFLPRLFVYGP